MKIRSLALALVASIGLFGAPSITFAGDADFTLVNKTGYDLREVYISPSKKNDWGNDRLGRNILANGSNRDFEFSNRASCMQDIRVVFDDDESAVVWENVNLCDLHRITITYNRATGAVNARGE